MSPRTSPHKPRDSFDFCGESPRRSSFSICDGPIQNSPIQQVFPHRNFKFIHDIVISVNSWSLSVLNLEGKINDKFENGYIWYEDDVSELCSSSISSSAEFSHFPILLVDLRPDLPEGLSIGFTAFREQSCFFARQLLLALLQKFTSIFFPFFPIFIPKAPNHFFHCIISNCLVFIRLSYFCLIFYQEITINTESNMLSVCIAYNYLTHSSSHYSSIVNEFYVIHTDFFLKNWLPNSNRSKCNIPCHAWHNTSMFFGWNWKFAKFCTHSKENEPEAERQWKAMVMEGWEVESKGSACRITEFTTMLKQTLWIFDINTLTSIQPSLIPFLFSFLHLRNSLSFWLILFFAHFWIWKIPILKFEFFFSSCFSYANIEFS